MIELKDEIMVYTKEEKHYKLLINGKEVLISRWHECDDYNIDGSIDIFEGEKLLTEEEHDEVIDFIGSL